MKIWEEDWTADQVHDGHIFGRGDRAQLAAAAPEMARLLLQLQKVVFPTGDVNAGGCASCGGGSGWASDAIEHNEGCELVTVLKKAGVR